MNSFANVILLPPWDNVVVLRKNLKSEKQTIITIIIIKRV